MISILKETTEQKQKNKRRHLDEGFLFAAKSLTGISEVYKDSDMIESKQLLKFTFQLCVHSFYLSITISSSSINIIIVILPAVVCHTATFNDHNDKVARCMALLNTVQTDDTDKTRLTAKQALK